VFARRSGWNAGEPSSLTPRSEHVNKPFDEWVEGWARVLRDFDGYSMGGFLRDHAGLSDEAIEAVGTLENMSSRLHLSFFHSFLSRSDINPGVRYWEIPGGSWRLPHALYEGLRDEVRLGHRMIRLEYHDPSRDADPEGSAVGHDGRGVTVQTVAENDPQAPPRLWTADLAIVTVPFSALRFVEIVPSMSYKKRRAIIETHYDSATRCCWSSATGGGSSPRTTGARSWSASHPPRVLPAGRRGGRRYHPQPGDHRRRSDEEVLVVEAGLLVRLRQ
jgi:hypothetical protein